jgi:hypothetical protein
MNMEKTGALVSRGIGIGLIILGLSSALYWPVFHRSGMATSGWTSSSSGSSATVAKDLATTLHDTYYVITSTAEFYVTSLAQALAGLAMMFFSRPIGRWLARGLSDNEQDDVHNQ